MLVHTLCSGVSLGLYSVLATHLEQLLTFEVDVDCSSIGCDASFMVAKETLSWR